MDWEQHRHEYSGSLNLEGAYIEFYGKSPSKTHTKEFLREIEILLPIKSRQVAAVALAMAKFIDT